MSSKEEKLPSKPEILVGADPTVVRLIPALATEIGLNESLLLVQLAFWIKKAPESNFREGRWWTYQSAPDIKKKAFDFWSTSTINRAANKLKELGLIFIDKFNEKKYDKTKWYALNLDGLSKLKSVKITIDGEIITPETLTQIDRRSEQNDARSEQNDAGETQNDKPIPETPIKTPIKEKDSSSGDEPKKTPEKKASKPRAKNPSQESIAYAFKISPGSFATKLGQQLAGTATGKRGQFPIEPPMVEPLEITAFGYWYEKKNKNVSGWEPSKDPETIQEKIMLFRDSKHEYQVSMGKAKPILDNLLGIIEPVGAKRALPDESTLSPVTAENNGKSNLTIEALQARIKANAEASAQARRRFAQ